MIRLSIFLYCFFLSYTEPSILFSELKNSKNSNEHNIQLNFKTICSSAYKIKENLSIGQLKCFNKYYIKKEADYSPKHIYNFFSLFSLPGCEAGNNYLYNFLKKKNNELKCTKDILMVGAPKKNIDQCMGDGFLGRIVIGNEGIVSINRALQQIGTGAQEIGQAADNFVEATNGTNRSIQKLLNSLANTEIPILVAGTALPIITFILAYYSFSSNKIAIASFVGFAFLCVSAVMCKYDKELIKNIRAFCFALYDFIADKKKKSQLWKSFCSFESIFIIAICSIFLWKNSYEFNSGAVFSMFDVLNKVKAQIHQSDDSVGIEKLINNFQNALGSYQSITELKKMFKNIFFSADCKNDCDINMKISNAIQSAISSCVGDTEKKEISNKDLFSIIIFFKSFMGNKSVFKEIYESTNLIYIGQWQAKKIINIILHGLFSLFFASFNKRVIDKQTFQIGSCAYIFLFIAFLAYCYKYSSDKKHSILNVFLYFFPGCFVCLIPVTFFLFSRFLFEGKEQYRSMIMDEEEFKGFYGAFQNYKKEYYNDTEKKQKKNNLSKEDSIEHVHIYLSCLGLGGEEDIHIPWNTEADFFWNYKLLSLIAEYYYKEEEYNQMDAIEKLINKNNYEDQLNCFRREIKQEYDNIKKEIEEIEEIKKEREREEIEIEEEIEEEIKEEREREEKEREEREREEREREEKEAIKRFENKLKARRELYNNPIIPAMIYFLSNNDNENYVGKDFTFFFDIEYFFCVNKSINQVKLASSLDKVYNEYYLKKKKFSKDE